MTTTTNPITREQFMQFFRADDFHDHVTPDDCIEIFLQVLVGSSDITTELLNELISDYDAGDNVVTLTPEEYDKLLNK